MEITFLGTGTSQGVPVIGCNCNVCNSNDPRDKRLRTSLLFKDKSANIVIDVGPDFRQQILQNPIPKLDAVLITHEHNDHVVGLDDIRPFYFRQRSGIEYYASEHVFNEIKNRFPYAFQRNPYPGAPKISTNNITPYEAIKIGQLSIYPLPVQHGKIQVYAFKIGEFTYITDASHIPPKTMDYIKGSKYLVINALRKEKHYSHFNLNEALEVIKEVNPYRAYITHISHLMGTSLEINNILPEATMLAHDGLTVSIQ